MNGLSFKLPCLNKIVEPTDFTFRSTYDMTDHCHGGAKPEVVLMHRDDQGGFLNSAST